MEKIDELRELLDLRERSSVQMVQLEGIASVEDDRLGIMRYVRTGDRAIVIAGPSSQLDGVLRENKADGTITIEFTFPASSRPKVAS
jgi:hypothetical protein